MTPKTILGHQNELIHIHGSITSYLLMCDSIIYCIQYIHIYYIYCMDYVDPHYFLYRFSHTIPAVGLTILAIKVT